MDIRTASVADLDLLLALLLDMERHYAGEGAVDEDTARRRLGEALEQGTGVMLMAVDAGAAVGFASLFSMFPTARLRTIWYLKELYVHSGARGRRIGETLIRHAAAFVVEKGGARLELTTDAQNLGAQKFYGWLGAVRYSKLPYIFEEDLLAQLAAKPAQGGEPGIIEADSSPSGD